MKRLAGNSDENRKNVGSGQIANVAEFKKGKLFQKFMQKDASKTIMPKVNEQQPPSTTNAAA